MQSLQVHQFRSNRKNIFPIFFGGQTTFSESTIIQLSAVDVVQGKVEVLRQLRQIWLWNK